MEGEKAFMSSNNFSELRDKCLYPHSPDVLERETSDRGFSQGWGIHFMPVEEYWTDIHAHLEVEDINDYREALQLYKNVASRLKTKYSSIIFLLQSRKDMGDRFKEILEHGIRIVREAEGFVPMLYIDYTDADPDIVDKAVQAGIKGIKLHNAPIVTKGASHKVWLSEEWRKVFEKIEKYRLPVLWHVTQRLTDAPYSGGGRNSYWKDGWLKGVEYTNQDLLDVFLEIVGCYPGINFVGAHQLHLGWERVAELFGRYSNLLVDTSCGCIIREFDHIYESDRDYIRKYFINYSSRILFGTDTIIRKSMSERYVEVNNANHMRFIRQLQLPNAELQRVAHGNFDRLFGLEVKG